MVSTLTSSVHKLILSRLTFTFTDPLGNHTICQLLPEASIQSEILLGWSTHHHSSGSTQATFQMPSFCGALSLFLSISQTTLEHPWYCFWSPVPTSVSGELPWQPQLCAPPISQESVPHLPHSNKGFGFCSLFVCPLPAMLPTWLISQVSTSGALPVGSHSTHMCIPQIRIYMGVPTGLSFFKDLLCYSSVPRIACQSLPKLTVKT